MSTVTKTNWQQDAKFYLAGVTKSLLASIIPLGVFLYFIMTSPPQMTIADSRYFLLLLCLMCWSQGFGEGFGRGLKWEKRQLPKSEQSPRSTSIASPAHLHWFIFLLLLLIIVPWLISSFLSRP